MLKLEQEGSIATKWGVSENNRRAKFYRITRTGRAEAEAGSHASLIGLVGAIADGVYSCARLAVMNSDPGDANGARRTGNARETPGSVHVDAVITASR